MERAARIPLVRTRRRRPKPPIYWALALLFALHLAYVAIDVLKLLDEPNPATALILGHDVIWTFLFRYGMRVVDPDDTPGQIATTATVAFFTASWALDVARWCLFGFGSG